MSNCRVCGDLGPHDVYRLREMMFGTRESFEYFQCRACECLQIGAVPLDLARHYPKNYYAQSDTLAVGRHDALSPVRQWTSRQVVRPALFDSGFLLSRVLRRGRALPAAFFRSRPEMLRRAQLSGFGAPILDVGCGEAAVWLRDLRTIGFSRLVGVDPFLARDARRDGIELRKAELTAFADEAPASFELIAFNHSLEHIPQQAQTLAAASRLLKSGGTCVIRIPMLPNSAWAQYGVHWVELDAPRHLYIHSRKSIEHLASQIGLQLEKVSFDTSAFEVFGSEQYQRGIALTDPRSAWLNPATDLFSADEMAEFARRAERMNADGSAGRAVLEFHKP